MTSILMAGCYDFFIIRWIAQILGVIMSALYSLFSFVGIYNIGLCIVAFTIIVKMLMFPMTLKQQKFTKVSSVMQPELQAIQKKYQNKKDNDSMIRMQQEQESKTFTAKAGGGMVSATVSGKHELVDLQINPEAVDPDDVEMLQDMILAAVNEAMRTADAEAANNMSRLTGGMNLGGLF